MAPTSATQFNGFSFGQGMGHRGGGDNGSGVFKLWVLIQLLAVLLILLLSFLPSSDPIYTLTRSYPYEYGFTTQKGVNYYVKTTKFEQDYPPGSAQRVSLEGKVDREYFTILAQNCRLEFQRRQLGFIRETPHCDMLEKFLWRLDDLDQDCLFSATVLAFPILKNARRLGNLHESQRVIAPLALYLVD